MASPPPAPVRPAGSDPSELPAEAPPRRADLRRYRRVSRASVPFFPVGFFALLGLLAAVWFAFVPLAQLRIEGTLRDAARARLAAEHLDWVKVGVSGRTLWLTGPAPSPEEADRAAAAVRDLTVATWLGELPVVDQVKTEFTSPAALEPAAPAATVWTDWEFRLERGVLALTGVVPDDDTRNKVLGAAHRAIDVPRISDTRDNLRVSDGPASEAATLLAVRGVDALGRCTSGVARLAGGEFSLRCELPQARVDEVRQAATAPLPEGRVGVVELVALEEIEACEAALTGPAAALRFERKRAELAPDAPLDAVAEAARACPGALRVAAPAEDAPELGAARADAVVRGLVDKGIAPDRIAAASEPGPVRRVEIRVARSTESSASGQRSDESPPAERPPELQ